MEKDSKHRLRQLSAWILAIVLALNPVMQTVAGSGLVYAADEDAFLALLKVTEGESVPEATEEDASSADVGLDESPQTAEPSYEEPPAQQPVQENMLSEEPSYEAPPAQEAVQENIPSQEPAPTEANGTGTAQIEPIYEEEPSYEEAAQPEPSNEAASEETAEQEPAQVAETGQEEVQEQASYEEAAEEEPPLEEAAQEEPAVEEAASSEAAAQEEPAVEEAAQEEASSEAAAQEEPAVEEAAQEEVSPEAAAQEEPAGEEAAQEETSSEEPAGEEAAQAESSSVETAPEEPAGEEAVQKTASPEEAAQAEPSAEQKAPAADAAAADQAEKEAAETAQPSALQKPPTGEDILLQEAQEAEESKEAAEKDKTASEKSEDSEEGSKDKKQEDSSQGKTPENPSEESKAQETEAEENLTKAAEAGEESSQADAAKQAAEEMGIATAAAAAPVYLETVSQAAAEGQTEDGKAKAGEEAAEESADQILPKEGIAEEANQEEVQPASTEKAEESAMALALNKLAAESAGTRSERVGISTEASEQKMDQVGADKPSTTAASGSATNEVRGSELQKQIMEKLNGLTEKTKEIVITIDTIETYEGDVTIKATDWMKQYFDDNEGMTIKLIAAETSAKLGELDWKKEEEKKTAEEAAKKEKEGEKKEGEEEKKEGEGEKKEGEEEKKDGEKEEEKPVRYAGDGDGKAFIDGNLSFDGVNVLIQGVTLTAKKILSMKSGNLQYYGNKKDETLTVQLGNKASADIYMYEGKDTVDVTLAGGAKYANVYTGDGNDTITLTAISGSAVVDGGAGNEKITAKILDGAGKVDILGGAGNDTVNATLSSAGGTLIDTAEGDDAINVDAQFGASNLTIEAGAGDDTVGLKKTDTVVAHNNIGSVDINLGKGADRLDLDLSAAYTFDLINVDGGNDNVKIVKENEEDEEEEGVEVIAGPDTVGDRLHITGILDPELAEDARLGWDDAEKDTIRASVYGTKYGYTQTISETVRQAIDNALMGKATLSVKGVSTFENLTDELFNKKQVLLSDAVKSGQFSDFTSYVADQYTVSGNGADNTMTVTGIALKPEMAAGLTLSDILIDQSYGAKNNIFHIKVGDVDVQDLNLRVKGEDITFTGTAQAKNIIANAGDNFGMYSHQLSLQSVSAAAESIGEMLLDMVNLSASAKITVEKDAKLIAKNDIDLVASIDQKGEILSVMTLFNPANVKIGSASVTVKKGAELWAGYEKSGNVIKEASTTNGNVRLAATVKAVLEAGYGLAATSPIAVNVAIQNAEVEVEEGASVTAGRNITLEAKNEATAKAGSRSGLGGFPLAISTTVLYGNATSFAKGTLTAGGSINVKAAGVQTGDTTAIQQEGITSGGYVAVQVAKQNVQAEVGSRAVLSAGKGVNVTADATEKLTAKANAAAGYNQKPSAAEQRTALGFSVLGSIWTAMKPSIQGMMGSNGDGKSDAEKKMEELDKKIKSVAGSDYTIQMADDSESKGDVDIKTASNPDGSGNIAEIYVKPWSGYTVERVYYRYLDNDKGAADQYTIRQATYNQEKKCWNFLQTNKEIYVYIDYKEKKADEREDIQDVDDSHSINSVEGLEDTSKVGDGDDPFAIWDNNPSYSINDVDDGDEEDEIFGGKKEKSDINIDEAIKDATSGTQENAEEPENEEENGSEGSSEPQKIAFRIVPDEDDKDEKGLYGAILTKKYNIVKENGELVGRSITEAAAEEEVLFVVNLRDGFKLAEGGLTVSYYVSKEGGVQEEKTIVLEKNKSGYYSFKVPSDMVKDSYKDAAGKTYSFQVKSKFEAGAATKKGNTSSTQLSGAVAVTVADVDNTAAVQAGSKITAGGALTVNATEAVTIENVADGTAISKESANAGEKKDDKPKAREQKTLSDMYIVPAHEYAVTVSKVEGGTVDVKAGGYTYTFTPKQGDKAVTSGVKAIISYTFAGLPVSQELQREKDGTFRLNLTSFPIDKGAKVDISFVYDEKAKDEDGNVETQDAKSMSFPISVSYNALKLPKDEDPYDVGSEKMGNVYYVRTLEETDKDGKTVIKYLFDVRPDKANGYTVKDNVNESTHKADVNVLWVEYKDNSGAVQKKPLTLDLATSYWYFTDGDISGVGSVGNPVVVHVVFAEDNHKLTPKDLTDTFAHDYDPKKKGGTISFSKDSAKATDEVTVTLKANNGYKPDKVKISYTDPLSSMDETQIIKVDNEGKAKFNMPQLGKDKELYVDAIFTTRAIGVVKGIGSTDLVTYPNESLLYGPGDSVELKVTDDAAKEGRKIVAVNLEYVNDKGETVTAKLAKEKGKYILPSDMDAEKNPKAKLSVDLGYKMIALPDAETGKELEHGKMTFTAARADKGDQVQVKVEPESGYILKEGSGKVNISAGTKTWQVVLKRQEGGTYAFTIPAGIDDEQLSKNNVTITMTGEFEKGYDNTQEYETSLGAAIAVTVSNIDNFAEIRGGTISATSGTNVNAKGTDVITTTAKAGFSKAATGVSGGIAVHVTSNENKGFIKTGTDLTTGSLTTTATGAYTYNVIGDASGNGQASGTGVGAGIAVAVNSAETIAGIQDGIQLNYAKGDSLSAVTVTSSSTVKDTVAAKAGAKGGSAGVPVVAVDVTSSEAKAYLGNLKVKGSPTTALGILKNGAKDVLTLTATHKGTHTITADASAAGAETAVGAAIAVSVVNSDTSATLYQSISSGGKLNIKSDSQVVLKETATASAAGGQKGSKKSDGSKGSTDKQTDNILGGVSRLASKNGNSSGMKDAQNRQQAQTSEGSVAGAGSVVVNVFSNRSAAAIADGVNISAMPVKDEEGNAVIEKAKLSVFSINRSEVDIKANSSTTKSDTGVGVGVAVNVVNSENTALIGSGSITVDTLTLKAVMPDAVSTLKKVVKPVTIRTKDQMVLQLANSLGDTINEWIRSKGLPTDVFGDMASAAAYDFVNLILEQTGLQKLLGTGSFEEKMTKAKALLNDKLTILKSIPELMLGPIMTAAYELEDMEGYSTEDFKSLLNTILNEIAVQMPVIVGSTMASLGQKAVDGLITTAVQCMNEAIKGNEITKEKLQKKFDKQLENLFNAELQLLTEKIIEDVFTKLAAEIPVLSRQNMEGLVDTVKAGIQAVKTGDENTPKLVFTKIATDLVTIIKTKLFDYDAFVDKIMYTDWKKTGENIVREYLKKASVDMENILIDELVGQIDITLATPEDNTNKNVINTQAISGVGAKNVGVAGSVAITVYNAKTTAEMTKGDNIDAEGNLLIEAAEGRRLKNIASASTDDKGNADQNKEAGDKEKADTGSGGKNLEYITDNVAVDKGVGLVVQKDKANEKRIYLSPENDGFQISTDADDSPTYSYEDRNGDTHTGKLQVQTETVKGKDESGNEISQNRYFIDLDDLYTEMKQAEAKLVEEEKEANAAADAEASKDKDGNDTSVAAPTAATVIDDVDPTKTYKVVITAEAADKFLQVMEVTAATDESGVDIPNDTVTVTVEGRDKKSAITSRKVKDNAAAPVGGQKEDTASLEAKADDIILVKIDRKKIPDGYMLDEIRYLKGSSYEVAVSTLRSCTEDEYVYEFLMPEESLTSIDVWFTKGVDNTKETKNDKGQSVGVGASFSMIYGDSEVYSRISDRNLSAANVTVNASSDHQENVTAVAGTDPLKGTADDKDNPTKDFALDAAVALNILDNSVKVIKGTPLEDERIESGTPKTSASDSGTADDFGNTKLKAAERSVTNTRASGFAVGNSTAVGAAVAVNISQTDVNVELNNGLSSNGNIDVSAVSYSEDYTSALATAMGADVQRSINKLNAKLEKGQKKAQSLLDGSIFNKKAEEEKKDKDKKGSNAKNKTASMINSRLNKDNEGKSEEEKEGTEASNNLSLSSNILRNQNVQIPGSEESDSAIGDASKELENTTGQSFSGEKKEEEKKSFQLAAAVGVTVASHKANVLVRSYVFAGKNATIHTENAANFATLATGAAMSGAEGAGSVAAAVAVSVSNNKANTELDKNIVAKTGDLTVDSKLTQNMDGAFLNRLAAQAVAGAVSGAKSDESIAGAVSVAVSNAKSKVEVKGGSSDKDQRIIGGDYTSFRATDKSKLGIRAGGLSISKGSSKGMGLSAAVLVSNNEVGAVIGDYTKINVHQFTLSAEKEEVNSSDYKFPLSWKNLITDSSKLTEEQRQSTQKGLIDIRKGKDDKHYTIQMNMSTNDVLKGMEVLNGLAYTNYYAEAIGGSVVAGEDSADYTAAGSVAVNVFSNKVNTSLGNNVILNATHDVNINGESISNTRIIAGAISAGKAKKSAGVTVGVSVDQDEVLTHIGDNAQITSGNNFSQSANASGKIQVFTAAAAVAVGEKDGKAGAGAVNVVVTKNKAINENGKNGSIDSHHKLASKSVANMDILLASGSLAGTSGETAAGGTVSVVVDQTKANTSIGAGRKLHASDYGIELSSQVNADMISAMLAMSAAAKGKSGAGAVNVLVDHSSSRVDVGSKAKLLADGGGSVKVTSDSDTRIINAMLSAAGGKKTAVGMAIGVNVIGRESIVHFDGRDSFTENQGEEDIEASEDVIIKASGSDTAIMAGLAASGSTKGSSLSGTVQVNVASSKILTEICEIRTDKDGNEYKVDKGLYIRAYHDATLSTDYTDMLVNAAGSIAMSNTDDAMGATVITVVKSNEVQTNLGRSLIHASGDKGINVSADARETQFIAGAGIAAGGDNAVNGVVNVLVFSDKVQADASMADLKAMGNKYTKSQTYREKVPAYEHTYLRDEESGKYYEVDLETAAAAMQAGRRAYYDNPTGSRSHPYVYYRSVDDLYKIETGIRKVDVYDVSKGRVRVAAKADTKQTLIAGGISFGLSNAAGAAVNTVVSKKQVKALANNVMASTGVTVSAYNKDDLSQIAVNAGVGLKNAVSIGATVQVLKSKAIANIGGQVRTYANNLDLTADNHTDLLNIAGVVAGGGKIAATPVANVTYFQGKTDARMKEGSSAIIDRGNASIKANASKDVNMFTVGASFGGTAGISGAVGVLVSEDKTYAGANKNTSLRLLSNLQNEAVLDITATNKYTLRSASAAVAGGGQAAAAVNASVSVMKSNTTAELEGTATTGEAGTVNVKSRDSRDVVNILASLAAGQAGAGVNVLVLVAGAKMSQDAADMLAYGNDDDKYEKDEKGQYVLDKNGNKVKKQGTAFDANRFMANMESNGIESKYYQDDEEDSDEDAPARIVSGSTLASDLSGNGYSESQKSNVGHVEDEGNGEGAHGAFDGSSGYRSSDFNKNSSYKESSGKGRGENLEAKDTDDVANAKNLGMYEYKDDQTPSDAVIAVITKDATVSASGVNVIASQPVAADLAGVSIGVGNIGVAITTTVAILHSNVVASSKGIITRADETGVTVAAGSYAGEMEQDEASAKRDSASAKLLGDKLDPSKRSIRSLGVAMGAGAAAGVAVGVSVLLTDNNTQATLGGRVENARNVTVKSAHLYDNILSATGAVSFGGTVAANASVAVAQANGKVDAAILRGTVVDTTQATEVGSVNVYTNSRVGVNAIAATAGASLGGAINAGVGLAFNRLTQSTGIRAGAKVKTGGNVNVRADSDTEANSYLVGIAVGAAAIVMNAAVSDVKANLHTYIGENDASLSPVDVTAGGDVKIRNDVSSTSTPKVLSVAIGGVAAGGNVLLAFNRTEARARLINAAIKADDVDVISDLGGTAESVLASAAIGGLAAGLSVNYADIQALNQAIVDTSGGAMEFTGDLNVRTGVGKNSSTLANAHTVSAAVGLATANLNAAIARNNTKNYANILGANELKMTGGDLVVHAYGDATANAEVEGFEISLGNVSATAVVALNDASAITLVRPAKLTSRQKSAVDPIPLTVFDATQRGSTTAHVVSGGGSLLDFALTVGLAYGRMRSVVDVEINKEANLENISSTNTGIDVANTKIENGKFSAISATALYGAAYTQDVFTTRIRLAGEYDNVVGDVNVLTNYFVKSDADVSPSSGGLSVKLASIGQNVAMAKNTASAGASFEALNTETAIGGNVIVKTLGGASTSAKIAPAKFDEPSVSAEVISAGQNIADSELSMQQTATMRVGGEVTVGGIVDVQSLVNGGGTDVTAIKRGLLEHYHEAGKVEDRYDKKGNHLRYDYGEMKIYQVTTRINEKSGKEVEDLTLLEHVLQNDVQKMADSVVDRFITLSYEDVLKTNNGVATASLGTPGGAGDIKISLASRDDNKAYAKENMSSTAGVIGGYFGTDKYTVKMDKGQYELQKVWGYDYNKISDEGVVVRDQKTGKTTLLPKTVYTTLQEYWNDHHWDGSEYGKACSKYISKYGSFKNNGWMVEIPVYAYVPGEYEIDPNLHKYVFRPGYYDETDIIRYDLLDPKTGTIYVTDPDSVCKRVEPLKYSPSVTDPGSIEPIEYYHPYGEYDELVWVPRIVEKTVEVEKFDADRNTFKASGLTIISGNESEGKTKAIARTDGGMTLGLVTAGNLDARAISSDSFYAMFDGMHAEIRKNGDTVIKAETNTDSYALGYTPGKVSLVNGGKTNANARIGSKDDKETAAVVIGKNTTLITNNLYLDAVNYGNVESKLDNGTSVSAASVEVSTLPTESWYSTQVSIGENAKIEAKGNININNVNRPSAKSVIESKSLSFAFNANVMMGMNVIDQESTIDIGNGAVLAKIDHTDPRSGILISMDTATNAQAETLLFGGALLSGNAAYAKNYIKRTSQVRIGDGATIDAQGRNLSIQNISGRNESIKTNAHVASGGVIAIGDANATTEITSRNDTIVGKGVTLKGQDVKLHAISTSYKEGANGSRTYGINTLANVTEAGLGVLPHVVAKNVLNFSAYVGINRKPAKANDAEAVRTTITSLAPDEKVKGNVDIYASTEKLKANADAHGEAAGLVGYANMTTWIVSGLENGVWIDNADITGENVSVQADTGRLSSGIDNRTNLRGHSYGRLYSLGKVAATVDVTGNQVNQVRSSNTKNVELKATNGSVVHKAPHPITFINQESIVLQDFQADTKVIKVWFIKLAAETRKIQRAWKIQALCDFCEQGGTAADIQPSEVEDLSSRYQDIYDTAMANIATIQAYAQGVIDVNIDDLFPDWYGAISNAPYASVEAMMADLTDPSIISIEKVLSAADGIDRTSSPEPSVYKARYGEEEEKAADKIFVTALENILTKDVSFGKERLAGYRLWTNSVTHEVIYLLPNATKLYAGGPKLDFVSEVLRVNLLGGEEAYDVDIYTALTEKRIKEPVVPIGSTGSLDFASGVLTLPNEADYELYLHEISASWLIKVFNENFLRWFEADPEASNAYVLSDGESLPEGVIVEGLTEDGEKDGRKIYWLGARPETAEDENQTLIYLTVDERDNEVDAFRTSPAMIEAKEDAIDVSLYLFRDSKSDRMGEEKYNVLFFDTPEGKKSLVKVVTDVLDGRDLEMPLTLEIELRGHRIEGTDLPVYSLGDHFLIVTDGTKGETSLFDGAYQAVVDEEAFESDYIRVEGIIDGNYKITVKADQPIWAERTGADSAEDLEGNSYIQIDGRWEADEEASEVTESAEEIPTTAA